MDRNLADTKSKAQSMIMAGQVYVNDKIITKSGNSFNENSKIKIKQLHPPWVSRGAFKLLKAIDHFNIDIENKIKYNESIIRHLFISVKEHDGEDSQLLIDSRNKKSESEDEESNVKNEVKEKPADDDEKKNEEEIVSKEESIEDISSDSIEEDSKDE